MASIGGKIRKFANNPFVRYGAAAMAGGVPAVAAMGARDIYKKAKNHPVGLGGLPAPHPSFPNLTPSVLPPPSNTSGLGLPKAPSVPDYMPPPPAATGFGALTPPSAPVNTSGLGLSQSHNNNFANLFPPVIPPPVDTSRGGSLPHPGSFGLLTPPTVLPPPSDTSGLGMTQTPNLTNPNLFSGVVPPPGSSAGENKPSPFSPSSFSGLNNDGFGGLTRSGSADENSQYGYWGRDTYENPFGGGGGSSDNFGGAGSGAAARLAQMRAELMNA